ncbi:MAG: magnesium/cobalt transporter CorA [Deltaproteobacteria bacterium]
MLRVLTYSEAEGMRRSEAGELASLLKDPKRLTWLDMISPTEAESRLLTEVFDFHPLAVEDCMTFVHNPKIDDYGGYLYVVVHGIDSEALKKGRLKTHDLDIFLGDNFIVTYHKGHFRSLESVMERCEKNPAFMGSEPDGLMHRLLDAMVDNYLPIMDRFADEMDAIEKEVFSRPKKHIPQKLLLIKKDVLSLRRIVYPQREILRQLGSGEYARISQRWAPHYKDIYDHAFMVSELIESYRDSITSTMDVYLSNVSNRLGEIMKVLTVIATIMMPLTLLTGIFGMNFQHIPLLDNPAGFYIILAFMGTAAGIMLLAFKNRGWW